MSYFSQLTQNVTIPPELQSAANINAGITYTTSGISTLTVNGIQVNLIADQNCVVYVDQSPDNTNWDITDDFNYVATLGGNSWTVQATASYVRIRVKNTSISATTFLRLQTALCPIVQPLPRATSAEGNLKTGIYEIEGDIGTRVFVSPMNALKTVQATRLVGTSLFGGVLDTNFWTLTSNGSATGSITNGQLILSTGTTTASSSSLFTNQIARYVGSASNTFRGVVRAPVATGVCTRRWGAFDASDGFFFEHNSSTGFSVNARKSGVDTPVTSSAFNGTLGTTYVVDTNSHTYEIHWTNSSVWFFIDGEFLHKISAATAPAVNTLHLKAGVTIANGANVNNNTLEVRTATIARLGELSTQSAFSNISTLGTFTLKYGPGNLHKIVVNNSPTSAGTVTVYDNTVGSGTKIATITLVRQAPLNQAYTIDFNDLPFSNGLTLVTATQAGDITVIYE